MSDLELAARGFTKHNEGWVSVGYIKTLPDGRWVYITRNEENMHLFPNEHDECWITLIDDDDNPRNAAHITGLRNAMDVADLLLRSEFEWRSPHES